ncbi:STAS domain-containing protein [Dactylosporangium sp. NPDC051541]|uniref:STAS domain-containing protein n=1 Tax=Dactylosporangium sp. NPDC051541 TaxID=3363977 RepID=UPI00379C3A6F
MTDLSVHTAVRPGGVTVLTVRGEIDWTNSHRFDAAVQAALAGPPTHLEVDLTAVVFMNSVGLAILLAGGRRAREEGIVYDVRPGPIVALLLERTGTAGLLSVGTPAPRAAGRRWRSGGGAP